MRPSTTSVATDDRPLCSLLRCAQLAADASVGRRASGWGKWTPGASVFVVAIEV
jgi:hypothetical protein